jgi:hypothetical protein
LDERRKSFAKKWHSKYNQFQRQKEKEEVFHKRQKAVKSAIGTERIEQLK